MTRASLATLPVELKAKIVRMASLQEFALRKRLDPEERVEHIDCLSSLALVNKEFRALAAKEQFKSLSSRRASLAIFRYRILPRYGHHVTTLYFRDEDIQKDPDLALTFMGQLPALRALSFDKLVATKLFGTGVTLRDDLGDEASCRAETLRAVSHNIETLLLSNFKPIETVALIRQFPHLVTLALFNLGDGNLEDQQELLSAIASAHRLDSLSVTSAGDFSGWPEALAPLERDPPPIRTLQLLSVRQFGNELSQFIGMFASTVRTLTLRVGSLGPDDDHAPITPIQLPNLTRLNLVIKKSRFQDVATFVVPSTLSSFSLVLIDAHIDPTEPTLQSFLTSQNTLQHVALGSVQAEYPYESSFITGDLLPPSFLSAYADFVRARDLDPSLLNRPHLTPFHPGADLNYTVNEGEYLEHALGRTLDFGKLELRRMIAEGNVAGAVEWVEMLRPLENKRLAWMD
ncbi:hypothetical protein RQP46_003361 [Phenoliferia psychrophenolica]